MNFFVLHSLSHSLGTSSYQNNEIIENQELICIIFDNNENKQGHITYIFLYFIPFDFQVFYCFANFYEFGKEALWSKQIINP